MKDAGYRTVIVTNQSGVASGLFSEERMHAFNAELVAQEFGWASAEQVTSLYGRSANSEAMRFLNQAWNAIPGDPDVEAQQR